MSLNYKNYPAPSESLDVRSYYPSMKSGEKNIYNWGVECQDFHLGLLLENLGSGNGEKLYIETESGNVYIIGIMNMPKDVPDGNYLEGSALIEPSIVLINTGKYNPDKPTGDIISRKEAAGMMIKVGDRLKYHGIISTVINKITYLETNRILAAQGSPETLEALVTDIRERCERLIHKEKPVK